MKIKKKFDTFWNFIIKKKNATQAAKKICYVYRHDAISVHVVQNWFKRFQSGNFDGKDAPRSDRSIAGKVDESWKKLSKTGTLAVLIGKELNIKSTRKVLNYLEKAG